MKQCDDLNNTFNIKPDAVKKIILQVIM